MQPERKYYLDYLKTISIFSVVLIHIFTTAKTDFSNHTQIEDIITRCIIFILHTAVPIFFMITGVLFLNKEKEITLKQLWGKYLKRYFIVLILFAYIFSLMENYLEVGLKTEILYKSIIDLLKGKSWNHMWYLYELIGIFLILPVIKILAEKMDENKVLKIYILVLLFIFNFIFPMINYNTPIKIRIFSEYVIYIFVGYFIDKTKNIKINKIKNAICAYIITIILALIFATIYSISPNIEFFGRLGAYNSPLIFIMSISLFCIFKNIKYNNKILNKIAIQTSQISLWIYIIHMLYINLLYKFLKFNIYGDLFILKVIIVFIIIWILSYVSAIVLKKIADKIKL